MSWITVRSVHGVMMEKLASQESFYVSWLKTFVTWIQIVSDLTKREQPDPKCLRFIHFFICDDSSLHLQSLTRNLLHPPESRAESWDRNCTSCSTLTHVFLFSRYFRWPLSHWILNFLSNRQKNVFFLIINQDRKSQFSRNFQLFCLISFPASRALCFSFFNSKVKKMPTKGRNVMNSTRRTGLWAIHRLI